MEKILCIDNSGSTAGCIDYWDSVKEIYDTFKPDKLIYWNHTANYSKIFSTRSNGCTYPQSFLKLLLDTNDIFDLIVTTDGSISDHDINNSVCIINDNFLKKINSVTIYYIGYELDINIGLNIIFNDRINNYYINGKIHNIINFNNIDDDCDVLDPNFNISLIAKINNIKNSYKDEDIIKDKLSELRGNICRIFSKLENKSIIDDNIEKYYKNNDQMGFHKIIMDDKLNVGPINKQKCIVLNYFDKNIDINLSKIYQSLAIKEVNVINENDESDWISFEDPITFENIDLPCLLINNINEPIITDKIIIKHPFKLLSNYDYINKIVNIIEKQTINYSTFKNLYKNNEIKSPYTNLICKGVYIIENKNMDCIKNNCRTISVIFGNSNKIPGNMIIWNLIILYIIYKHKKNIDDEYKRLILSEIIKYCDTYKTSLSITHQCQIIRKCKINICFWYIFKVLPKYSRNTSNNVLRSIFAMELYEFYVNTIGSNEDNIYTDIKKWAVWNYLISNRNKKNLKLELKAQYQNYIIYKNEIILTVGECDKKYDSFINILDSDIVNSLYNSITNTSSKIDNIDNIVIQKYIPIYKNIRDESLIDTLSHIIINKKTCWPMVICPVTKKHWKECIGNYNIKNESLLRLFNTYCLKYESYPNEYMDLVLLYFKITNIPIDEYLFECFKKIMIIFYDIINTYDYKTYIKIYKKHSDENLRLSKEI
ncbi:unknown similar to AgseGV orf4 [Mythimna separata entomopoxvirus 'L']|uniref:Uncharacterized protein n=1 Tax=Mythimna separata entomopoxvirus 'L' TaxID=1293572 RepID=A0A916KQ35_9POXV|nr:unknown similar to AgseGV orf4 [Mythimna separata entomopoxvirus 'L']CCU56208.1 unknown similar to AgseGV orf4 [Mythimna separata entomopoxvirus 'L']